MQPDGRVCYSEQEGAAGEQPEEPVCGGQGSDAQSDAPQYEREERTEVGVALVLLRHLLFYLSASVVILLSGFWR